MTGDNRPFPIQGELSDSKWGRQKACTIPWWLAEEAYKRYVESYGESQPLERLAERGGFGREELLLLLRCNNLKTRNRDQRSANWEVQNDDVETATRYKERASDQRETRSAKDPESATKTAEAEVEV